jgi:hypothetical protein
MVHARAVDDRRLRDRSSARRHFSNNHALARRAGIFQRGLLSRDRTREKLVWTSALGPGYRPAIIAAGTGSCEELYFTAIIMLEAQGARTKYTAVAMHADEATSKKHEKMGFYQGWGAALDQLVDVAKRL